MTATVSYHVDTTEVEAMLHGAEVAASPVSMHEFLADPVAAFLRERASERFASSGDEASGKWQPLADWTVQDRGDRGLPEGPPLIATGSLHDFLTSSTGHVEEEGEATRLLFPGEDSANEAKLATHQRGMANPWTNAKDIPARPVAALGAQDASGIEGLLHAWFDAKAHVGI